MCFLVLIGLLTWVLFFGYVTLIRPGAIERLTRLVFRIPILSRYSERARAVAADFRRRADLLREQPFSFYLRGLGVTALPWLFRYVLILFVIWTVYPAADGLLVFLRAVALNLSVLALPTPGGAGGAEGLYALFFGPPLLPSALVAPTLLVWRILSYYLFIVVGLFIVVERTGKRIRRSQRAAGNRLSFAEPAHDAHE